MIKSMTGYGRGEFIENDLTVTVEIKSVSHRFFECQIKAPRQFSFLEDKLKSYIQSRVNRGKLDVFVSYSFQRSFSTFKVFSTSTSPPSGPQTVEAGLEL